MQKNFISELQNLADPAFFIESLNIKGWDSKNLLSLLSDLLKLRYVEEAIANLVLTGKAKCPCHLGIGQEAIAVGVSRHLKESDRVFGAHRSHTHYLALGGSTYSLLAEVLGKSTGCSRGMGGSMHLHNPEVGFAGSVPIVAGTVPLAVGAAMAAKMDKSNCIAVAYFGDGASEEGVIHESLNLAKAYNLPVLFVCENNLYSSHLDICLRQPSDRIARFADAHHIKNKTIDGNDVIEVAETAQELIQEIRSDKGPAFLEAITYRWAGHVGPDPNIDVGVRRSLEDVNAWKKRDPITRLFSSMKEKQMLTEEDFEQLKIEELNKIKYVTEQALQDPYPENSLLLDGVYSK